MVKGNLDLILGQLKIPIALTAFIGAFSLGPIDISRTVYNQIIGDTLILKKDLVDYSRRGIQIENPKYNHYQIEFLLANELNYRLDSSDKINPQEVDMSELWDTSEKYARSFYQRWFFPLLKE